MTGLIDPACGKRPYPSRAEAERVLRTIRTLRRRRRGKKRSDVGVLRAYLCEDCVGVWHLTSNAPHRALRPDTIDDATNLDILPRGRRNVPVAALLPEETQ